MNTASARWEHPRGCRLLYLVGQLTPGGMERQLCYLLERMDRERYHPAVAVWNFTAGAAYVRKIRALDIPIYASSRIRSGAAKLCAFRRLVGKLQPEVVHSYSFYTNIAAQWSILGTRAVAVGSVRGDFTLDKKDAGACLGRLSARWPRHQICNSSAAAEASRRSGSVFAPKQMYVVRNGLDVERFRSVPSVGAAAGNGARVSIVGVGSLVPAKRWERLVWAAAALKQRGVECVIRIAGDGELRGVLEQQARRLRVMDSIEFIGYTEDIPQLLAGARFLVHTSDSEGSPNAVLEAMACGRAVVATDAGDIPSLVDHGQTGFVVPRGDDETLVARMMSLIVDDGLCRRMGEAGRAKAERQCAPGRLVEDTLAAYRSCGWQDS